MPFAVGRAANTPLRGRYISRFRSPEKLQGESGYYLSSLVRLDYSGDALLANDTPRQTGAVNFIETMDHTALSKITQEEFEK